MAEAEILGLSPGFKFEPSDDELVQFFLLPRLRGQPLPFDGVVIEDDPSSAPPWKLFARNGRTNVDEAYFFATGEAKNGKGSRQGRGCAGGGTWVGQKLETQGELHVGDEKMVWQKYRLNFHFGSGRSGSTGWVMHEYTIVAPNCAFLKVCHVAFTGHGQKRKRVPDGYDDCEIARPQDAAAAPSSTTTWYQEFSAAPAHANYDQEYFMNQQSCAYNQEQLSSEAAAVHGETEPSAGASFLTYCQESASDDQSCQESSAHQEPFAVDPFLNQEQASLADLGFPSTAPADYGEQLVEHGHGTMPLTPAVEEFGAMTDQELQEFLESLADLDSVDDFGAMPDADYGAYWANAG